VRIGSKHHVLEEAAVDAGSKQDLQMLGSPRFTGAFPPAGSQRQRGVSSIAKRTATHGCPE
jgi:hypothetical protein